MQNDSKSQPLPPRASKVISKLIKLEREISSVVGRVRGGINRSQPRLKKRRAITAFVQSIKQNLGAVIALMRSYGHTITSSARKLLMTAIHSGSITHVQKRNIPPPLGHSVMTSPTDNRPRPFWYFLISACLGLVSLCVALILALFLQIRDLKTEVAQSRTEVALTKAQLSQLERAAQQKIVNEPTPATKAQPAHVPLNFSEADIKIIRQFIKVLPPKPGTLQKIHIGDEITNLTVAPVPESLIGELPKLRGARFSIDQDGAIIIIGEGSKRVDAVLGYN